MGAARLTRRALLTAALLLAAAPAWSGEGVRSADLLLAAPDGRAVPVRVTWPRGGARRLPLLLLSHGANGTLDGLGPLQRGLTRGRIVAAPRHPDSEANPDLAKVDRARVFPQRVGDMRLLLDSVERIERVTGKRVATRGIAAAGHSYGALVAQALGGALVGGGPGQPPRNWRDERVTRVVAFSPPGPLPGLIEPAGWAAMAVPQFVQTGTADTVPMIAPKWQAHMASFEAANAPGSVLWVGHGVDHYFGNRVQRLSRTAPDQSAAFEHALDLADAFLKGERPSSRSVITERLTIR